MADDVSVDMEGILAAIAAALAGLKDSRRLMERIGAYQSHAILSRTQAGRSVDGRPFPAYSEGYRKTRRKAGRPVNRMDLFFSGQMLGSLTHKVEGGDSVKLFWPQAEQAKKAAYNQRRFSFFGADGTDRAKIRQMVIEYVFEGMA